MRECVLPSWAKLISKGKVEIFADEFYPSFLKELGVDLFTDKDLELAFQCAKLDIQHAISGTNQMPPEGGALVIIVTDRSKRENGISKWKQKSQVKLTAQEVKEAYSSIRKGLV